MFKKLMNYIDEYKKDSILAPVYVTLEVVLEVIIPILMANLIDFGIDKQDMNYVVKIGIALLICSMITMTFGVLAGRSAAIGAVGFAKNLRKAMYENVQDFSFSNIDKFSTASIVTRLTTDVTNVQNAYQMIIRMAVRCPIMIIFSLIVCFRINVTLALIFLALVPVLGFGLFFIIKNAYPIFERVFKKYDKLNNVVQENLLGMRVVKSFVREDFEKNKFYDISNDIYKDFSKAEKTVAFNMPLMQLCMYVCMLLIAWFGARIIVTSGGNPTTGLSTGQLMSLITYAMQILMSLMILSMILVMITLSNASAKRIVEIIEEESDLKNCDNPIFEVPNGDITFENVNFKYTVDSDKECLQNINIKINSGETIGIVGGTGSSKTSLVQLIPRLYDATEGKVTVGGIDVRKYDIESLRQQVAFVLQKNVLFSGTIKENLRWGDENATDEDIKRVCILAQADEFISKFPKGYDTFIEQGGSNVSGGQRQRLCIARALLKKPKIIILDDSTSAVDTKTDMMIRKAFKEEIPDTTKIIIAQRISSVQESDRIIVMDDGHVKAFGSHEELLKTSDIYREMYESQVKGGYITVKNNL